PATGEGPGTDLPEVPGERPSPPLFQRPRSRGRPPPPSERRVRSCAPRSAARTAVAMVAPQSGPGQPARRNHARRGVRVLAPLAALKIPGSLDGPGGSGPADGNDGRVEPLL